jgi:hypothetical protein
VYVRAGCACDLLVTPGKRCEKALHRALPLAQGGVFGGGSLKSTVRVGSTQGTQGTQEGVRRAQGGGETRDWDKKGVVGGGGGGGSGVGGGGKTVVNLWFKEL